MSDTPATVEMLVVPSAEEMKSFSDAVRFGLDTQSETGVSTSFLVMSWLSRTAVRQLILAACPIGSLPMQVSQTVELGEEMIAGEVLTLTASLDRHDQQPKLNYAVTDSRGTVRTRGQIGFVWALAADINRPLS